MDRKRGWARNERIASPQKITEANEKSRWACRQDAKACGRSTISYSVTQGEWVRLRAAVFLLPQSGID